MANRIKESNITPGAVTSDKIAPGTVSASNISPGTITSDKIAPGTIANDRLANTGITINGTSIALGASGTIVAGTDWQAVVTADGSTATTASAGEGYFIDTTSNAHTINLPSSPTQGDEVTIVDYAGTFGTNNVTVGRNSSNIDGVASDGTLATNRLNVRFVYIDATQGWKAIFDDASASYGTLYITATGGTITTSGDYKIHTFTGDGCFVVSCGGNPAGSTTVDYLVVAGGGGGGSSFCSSYGGAGGGGAGGYRESSGAASGCYTRSPLGACVAALPVSATTYPVTVGAGGTSPGTSEGTRGSNSIFSTITSTGGGGGIGAAPDAGGPNTPGGSGGGGYGPFGGVSLGNTPPVSPPQGNNGGIPAPSICSPGYGRGAGGGATTAGAVGVPSGPGNGGNGATSSINGTPTTRAGGGGGGSAPGTTAGSGGPGGGGDGTTGGNGLNGTANTGGGAGGGGGTGPSTPRPGGTGGKGIVIIRYKYQN